MENRIFGLLIVSVILIGVDFYVLEAIKTTLNKSRTKRNKNIQLIYWLIVAITLAGVFVGIYFSINRGLRTFLFVWFFIHYFSKLFVVPFLLIDDIKRLTTWIYSKKNKDIIIAPNNAETLASNAMPRSEFLSKAGIIMAGLPFIGLNFGILSNNIYDYKIKRRKIFIDNLPPAFEGITIGQISDIHAGSFDNKIAVQGGVDLLNAEKCDVIFFTGDLVNDQTKEMSDYMNVFDKVNAPMGVYSIFGNHDYGDYKKWPSEIAKRQNLKDLVKVHERLGWNLLRNEHRRLKIGSESIVLIGVENWSSSSRFPKKGRLDLASKGIEADEIQLLLSHDPSHWRAQVIKDYPNIDMMFAGHTHGMQLGFEFGDYQWSPSQYVYPEWSGLYQQAQQKLYVNVGYGFLGYPGRIGILPEITIFELKRA